METSGLLKFTEHGDKMKRTYIQLITLSIAILVMWFLPGFVSDSTHHLIMGWIAGWQIGAWSYHIGDWISEKFNAK